jgi:lipopolysaccharide/colanic/teichoic acid biosynthesis glycosyltransferase
MYVSEPSYALLEKSCRCPLLKRTVDLFIASAGLLITAPVIIAVAVVVLATSKGPALFLHTRMGLGGKEFKLCKFRTMVQGAEAMKRAFTPQQQEEFRRSYKLHDDPRVTAFGRFLRRTSLDELPQLFNVLAGDMSIVGPRPVTREELRKYGDDAEVLLSVNPGMTGLWQISGRSDVSYEDRVRMDIRYALEYRFISDLKIMLSTFRVVFTRLGAY